MIEGRDYTVRIGTTAPGIDSYIVRFRDYLTIIISDQLSPQGRLEAYEHEIWHLEHDDLDRERDPELMEIIARQKPSVTKG